MAQVGNVGTSGNASQNSAQPKDALGQVDVNQFLKLMITELQNQDPLNPMDNAQMIQQIGELRSISSTDKLTSTLDSVLLGQNITSATNLMGADIEGVSDDNQKVSGTVTQVSVADGVPKLHLALDTGATPSVKEGAIDKGSYQYRVVWNDDKGQLIGVDPLEGAAGQKITTTGTAGKDQAILLSNLPTSEGPKQVYRRKSGDADFKLVDTLTNGSTSSYLDTKSNDELSNAVLVTAPSLISHASRLFDVSLSNVGQIRSVTNSANAAISDLLSSIGSGVADDAP